MVITRKIEVNIAEEDKTLRKDYVHTIYGWRDWVRRAANIIVAHKFVQQSVRDYMYFSDEALQSFVGTEAKKKTEKVNFTVKNVLRQEPGNSEQNTTYRVVASMLKGKVPADIYSCLNQLVSKTFKETVVDYLKGNASIRSYKNNIPVPFSAKALSSLRVNEELDGNGKQVKRYYFTLFGIPFVCFLGRDRSNNEIVLDRCLKGEYKICSSSLQFIQKKSLTSGNTKNQSKNKIFLLLSIDIPQKEVRLNPKKVLYAFLGVESPIVCTCDVRAKHEYDSGMKVYSIGSADEFLHRREQIQAAVRRCQKANRYTVGGKGRKKKCQAIDRWHDKERNYVASKIHLYSRMLVDMAVKHECGAIHLLKQKERETAAKVENQNKKPFLLRNWSYYNLKDKIAYKCKITGIKLIQDKEKEVVND